MTAISTAHAAARKGATQNNLEQQIQQLQRSEKGIEGARWFGFQYAPTASKGLNQQSAVFNFGNSHGYTLQITLYLLIIGLFFRYPFLSPCYV